jgi:hypothetical protein
LKASSSDSGKACVFFPEARTKSKPQFDQIVEIESWLDADGPSGGQAHLPPVVRSRQPGVGPMSRASLES